MFVLSKILRTVSHSRLKKHIFSVNNVNKLQYSYRYLHVTTNLSVKMFMERENKLAFSIIESEGYNSKIKFENKNVHEENSLTTEEFNKLIKEQWHKQVPEHIFTVFSDFAVYCENNKLCISSSIFDNYIDALTDNIKNATDEQLVSLFYSLLKWPETPSIRTRNFIEVWAALDDECLRRLKDWDYDNMLYYVYLFYLLNITKPSDFCSKSIIKLASKAKKLKKGQVVQTMFFISLMRRAPFDMHNLEIYLKEHFTEFTINDLAIMAMGFFKSKTPIRDPALIYKIIDKVIENSQTVNEVYLASLLKIIRYSLKYPTDDKIYEFLEHLHHEIPRLSIMCQVHLALLGLTTLTLHETCLNKIAGSVIGNMNVARIKDLERLVLAFGTFNFMPTTKECFIEKTLEELRKPERSAEINKYGRSFACCIGYLGLLKVYPVDLMSEVLSKEFLDEAYGKQYFNYGREVLTINNTAEIFCGDADMNRLTSTKARLLAKKYTDYMPSVDYVKQYNVSEKLVLDIMKVLYSSRGGKDFVIGDHILTHHQRGDIIICNDTKGSPVEVASKFVSSRFGEVRKPPDDNIWIALVVGGRNAFIKNTDVATGPFNAKIRELRALGYCAALVKWHIYDTFKTNEEKTTYLNRVIEEAIQNKQC